SRGKVYPHPFSDIEWILQQTIQSGKLPPEKSSIISIYLQQFKLASDFERVSANMDAESKALTLRQFIRTPQDAVLLADVVVRFLMTTPVSLPTRALLVQELMTKSGNLSLAEMELPEISSPGGMPHALTAALIALELPEEIQIKIFEFLTSKATNNNRTHHSIRARLIGNIFDHREWRIHRFSGAQRALEILAETAFSENNGYVIRLEYEGQHSSTDSLMRKLQSCFGEVRLRPRVCADISSAQAIYLKIAANVQLPQALRRKAAGHGPSLGETF
ncbi:MAG: hypothetical protein ACK5P5_00350, partial [Pseudobdellovibrionaceae bacterium]